MGFLASLFSAPKAEVSISEIQRRRALFTEERLKYENRLSSPTSVPAATWDALAFEAQYNREAEIGKVTVLWRLPALQDQWTRFDPSEVELQRLRKLVQLTAR